MCEGVDVGTSRRICQGDNHEPTPLSPSITASSANLTFSPGGTQEESSSRVNQWLPGNSTWSGYLIT